MVCYIFHTGSKNFCDKSSIFEKAINLFASPPPPPPLCQVTGMRDITSHGFSNSRIVIGWLALVAPWIQ